MSSEEAVDDQNSGWLEVKKKHRGSSKFSLHGWVGGFSGKQHSGILPSQHLLNVKSQNTNGKFGGQPSNTKGSSAVHGRRIVANPTLVSNKSDMGVHCLDKCVVSQDGKTANSVSQDNKSENSPSVTASKVGGDSRHLEKDDNDVLPKIKWGDLDDDALLVHYGSKKGPQISFGGIEKDDLFRRRAENLNASIASAVASEAKDKSAASATADHVFQEAQFVSIENTSCEANCKEPIKVSSEDVERLSSTERTFNLRSDVSSVSIASAPDPQDESAKFPDAAHVLQKEHSLTTEKVPFEEHVREVTEVSTEDVKMQITNEKTLDRSGDVTSCRETQIEHMKEINSEPLDLSIPFGEDSLCGVSAELPAPGICETGSSEILEVVVIGENSVSPVTSQHAELVLPESSGIDSSREDIASKSGADHGIKEADEFLDSMSKAQIMSAIDAGDTNESKERFRERLWCFLFENLNRAVDELYLLCELECDLEQMKEAILVLEEAASDFKELNSRVEDFERVKKSSPQLIDGATMHMNSDHRRPHALSWEVRRMTSSPHRAEILSSSLEAFRKIQEERGSIAANGVVKLVENTGEHIGAKELVLRQRKQVGVSNHIQGTVSGEKKRDDSGRSSKTNLVQNNRLPLQNQSVSEISASRVHLREGSTAVVPGKSKRELLGSSSDMERPLFRKDKMLVDRFVEERPKSVDRLKKQTSLSERDMDKSNPNTWKSMDAWKEKRNWEDILATPFRVSHRYSHSPGMNRKNAGRARILHDKLMSPEKKKKSAVDLKKEAQEKHARAMRIRSELENERVQKLQRTSEKVNRVSEWQAIRNMKLREVMYARHQRSESRHEAFLAQVVRRAGDESSKVNEVRFITSLNEENKKFMLRQKLHDSLLRRAEKLQTIKSKQKEDVAREEAVLERKKLIDAEKLQRLAETQRKKEEAQVRREEERKASSAAREAKAMEQQRRKEVRAKAQQEEAELLAQKLAERLSESEQRRKFYLEQIRERASMDFRDQSSPFFRRSTNREGQGRSTPPNNGDEYQTNNISGSGGSTLPSANASLQQSLKRRIKKIRQRLMALKYEFSEPSLGAENGGIGYRTAAATARAKIGRWLQDLQRLRQARKEGSASIGLITAEIIKFLEGKDPELQASRQAGLLGFIASALPASHSTKPEACQVTTYLLRLLKVLLSVPANRSYFLAQNLLPPIIPMLTAALENYIKIAASSNVQCSTSKLSMESISEVLDGFLWIVTSIIGHVSSEECQLQMQDGLVELVIAYRIIHRLRDLFALYDRPQVEGSPFPSSIILSIDLLAVLTSRFRTMSLINWESFPLKERSIDDTQEAMLPEKIDLECSPFCDLSGDHLSAAPLPDLPEDKPLNESFGIETNDNSLSIGHNTERPKFIINKMDRVDAPQEPERILIDKGVRYSVPQKDEKNSVNAGTNQNSENKSISMQPVAFLLSAMSETGLVCLPSPLTAVLLQANNKLSIEQATFILPSNFEEVATGVLKVLNNLALVDITFIQTMLARPDLKTEFFHLMNFLLSHCTSKWGSATDQIGSLLLESLLLLGYFALFHSENQAVLRWGKSPTILHKVCDLPFVFFSDPELMPVLAGTLVAACFGCEQNKCVVQQEISTDMLLSLTRSCKTGLPAGCSNSSTSGYLGVEESCESTNQLNPEPRKFQSETLQKSNRCSTRSSRIPAGKSATAGNGSRNVKMRNQKDGKAVRLCEEMFLKNHPSILEISSAMMLHSRFPGSFIDKAEQFFLAETSV